MKLGSRAGEKTTLWYDDKPTVTVAQIVAVIREQCEVTEFGYSDALRTAAMYLPASTPVRDWVEACKRLEINSGTARNRWREGRL